MDQKVVSVEIIEKLLDRIEKMPDEIFDITSGNVDGNFLGNNVNKETSSFASLTSFDKENHYNMF